MGKAEDRKSRSETWVGRGPDCQWYSVESGQLFEAAGESKGMGEDLGVWEGPTSPTEDSSSPPWEDPEVGGMGKVPCWAPCLASLPAYPDGQRRVCSRGQGPRLRGQGWAQASRPAASGSLLQLKGQGVPNSARPDWHWRSASWQTERQGGRTLPSGVQWGTSSPQRSLRKFW